MAEAPEPPNVPDTPAAKRNRSLALRLLDAGVAQDVLGGPVADGAPASEGVVRSMSMASRRAREGGGAPASG